MSEHWWNQSNPQLSISAVYCCGLLTPSLFCTHHTLFRSTTLVQALGFDEIGTKKWCFWNEITKATYLIGKQSLNGGWLKCLQDAVIAARPHILRQACTFTKSHSDTQFFNFLRSNINTLITSSLNPSLKIPLKKLVALPCPPAPSSFSPPLAALPPCSTSSYL